MSSKNRLRTFSSASLDSSVALSVSIRTKLSRSSVFAAMSSKMNVVIWNEFSLRRKSLGSSSFLKGTQRIMRGALRSLITRKLLLEKRPLFFVQPVSKVRNLRPLPYRRNRRWSDTVETGALFLTLAISKVRLVVSNPPHHDIISFRKQPWAFTSLVSMQWVLFWVHSIGKKVNILGLVAR